MREALDESYERNNKSQFIGELLEEDDRFAFLLDNPPVLKRMEAILGTLCPTPQRDSTYHRTRDPLTNIGIETVLGPLPPTEHPMGVFRHRSIVATISMKSPTKTVPRLSNPAAIGHPSVHPPTPVELPDEKRVLVSPGQAVMFDGWTWHRGAANNSSQRRRVCLMCYQNAWMKSREPFDGPRVTKLREEGDTATATPARRNSKMVSKVVGTRRVP